MKKEANDKELWNVIYEYENYTPGWTEPGVDYNITEIIADEIACRALKNVNILDIGCGNGRNSMLAENLSVDVNYTGCDFSEKALNYCRSGYSSKKRFIHLDITDDNLPLGNNYDIIFDCGCFHAIPPRKRVSYVNNLKKHSNKNTLIIIAGWHRDESHLEKDEPSYFPYLCLQEWFINKKDMEEIFKGEFKVTSEKVDLSMYKGLNKGFAYFTLKSEEE